MLTPNKYPENLTIPEFAEWILKIGDGEIGDVLNDEEKEITIPNDILIQKTAILAPTLDDVAPINEHMLSLLPGEESTYLSSNSISNQESNYELASIYTSEFLNTINGSGLPYHHLRLKVGAPIMLLRNIDKFMGLCNGK
ncbi:ATP-dependent DNA helicase PIF1-like [Senna tora]|uniref:ATP-dependent DNA helicase PIF1-like n=1 Tax=Senna tora TaxID=362788 RepID=A0A834X0S7_9FABA|nr:ATP-dependent DNA helicase PIF1-like [Senna tora]